MFSLEIRDSDGNTVMRTDTSIIGMPIDAPRGTSVMHFGIVQMPLLDGSFTFAARDPEPGRHPLRLAGAGGDVRGDEPGQDDRACSA